MFLRRIVSTDGAVGRSGEAPRRRRRRGRGAEPVAAARYLLKSVRCSYYLGQVACPVLSCFKIFAQLAYINSLARVIEIPRSLSKQVPDSCHVLQ